MKTIRNAHVIAVVLGSCFLAGCTTNINYVKARKLGGFQNTERIPVPVELRLTSEYRQSKWQLDFMGKTIIPFGPHLQTNTIDLAQTLFPIVTVTVGGSNAPIVANASAILLPRLLYVDITGENVIKGYLTMGLEWSMFDATNKLVWVDSFRAEHQGPIEGVKGIKKKLQRKFDLVLEDLFKQSREAMLASPEIRQFTRWNFNKGNGSNQ